MIRRHGILRNEKGATALEFALILPLFLGFIFAIIDVSAYFFVAGQLQHGVVQAARQIRTGNVVGNDNATRDAFRTAICANINTGIFADCVTSVHVDVRAFTSYGTITIPATLDTNNNGTIEDSETTFDTGGSSCPVLVRAFFNYHTLIPALQNVLAAVVPNTTNITAATAFRNEPFTGGTGSTCATAGDLN